MNNGGSTVASYKETVGCVIFWAKFQSRVHCQNAKPESNGRVSVDAAVSIIGVEQVRKGASGTIVHIGKSCPLHVTI